MLLGVICGVDERNSAPATRAMSLGRAGTAWGIAGLLAFAAGAAVAADAPADAVYRGGYVYTVDTHDSVQQALAVRDGKLVYVGTDAGVKSFVGKDTKVTDLHGRMLMPGLIDGHMHPLAGGTVLLKCNLKYERLTLAQMQAKIQHCLDQTKDQEPDGWLEVANWFQEAMLPAGTEASSAVLDSLHTKRPIFILSSFGHTGLANSRALQLAHVTASTPDPLGGKIAHDASGKPSGILQDAAFQLVADLIPKPTPAEDVKAAEAALDALRKQGVTTFLDAAASPDTLAAFAGAQKNGKLTARAHFAVLVKPSEGPEPQKAVEFLQSMAQRYDQGPLVPEPRMSVHNVKLFLDGVITAPALTGAMLTPYFANQGTAASPHWVPGANRGPDVYFPAAVLNALVIAVAKAGFEPHMHADGDRAVREGLNAIEALRKAGFSGDKIRAAIAHDEIVDPADFPRYAQLDAIPVLSLQWEKPAPDTIDGERDYLGPARFKYIEPAGVLAAAGTRIAYGSDWPVDPLDEWFALKVGVTRTNSPDAGKQYAGRLSEDGGLTRQQALRTMTTNASYELHQDAKAGSLEAGKLADFIVLDRNYFDVPAEQIADIKVLQTVVGGRVVYEAGEDANRHR
jgi:predicted amidohydrolase YtcJ